MMVKEFYSCSNVCVLVLSTEHRTQYYNIEFGGTELVSFLLRFEHDDESSRSFFPQFFQAIRMKPVLML